MSRWWIEVYDSKRHANAMKGVVDGAYQCDFDATPKDSLIRYSVVKVAVASFEFLFLNGQQLEVALEHFNHKIHPSQRVKVDGDHWEMQRWFERLPSGLTREPTRSRVVKALEQAAAGIAAMPEYYGVPASALLLNDPAKEDC